MTSPEPWPLPGPPPVGVLRLADPSAWPGARRYEGPAYCQAVTRAGRGELLVVGPGSVQVCRWAPPVLGLKQARGRFEEGLRPRLPWPVEGLLLGPLERLSGQAEVVIVRTTPEALAELLDRVPEEERHAPEAPGKAESALGGEPMAPERGLLGAVNRTLASMSGSAGFQSLTQRLFRSEAISAGFDALISRALADMSVCRNSTVIPLSTGRVNVSFFCTGGITWGGNAPGQVTSGWPIRIFERVFGTSEKA